MDALVLKARFEEAKAKALAAVRAPFEPPTTTEPTSSNKPQSEPSTFTPPLPPPTHTTTTPSRDETRRARCFNCGLEGHMARACPYEKSGGSSRESRGQEGDHGGADGKRRGWEEVKNSEVAPGVTLSRT